MVDDSLDILDSSERLGKTTMDLTRKNFSSLSDEHKERALENVSNISHKWNLFELEKVAPLIDLVDYMASLTYCIAPGTFGNLHVDKDCTCYGARYFVQL